MLGLRRREMGDVEEGNLHKDVIITMWERGGSGIDGFDGLKRISLEHHVGLVEFWVLLDFVGVDIEQLTDD